MTTPVFVCDISAYTSVQMALHTMYHILFIVLIIIMMSYSIRRNVSDGSSLNYM